MSSDDRRRLVWPPAGVGTSVTQAAVVHILAHHDAPSDPQHVGPLDPAGVAAAVGAEQLARVARTGSETAVELGAVIAWLRAPGGGEGPVVDGEVTETVEEALAQIVVGLVAMGVTSMESATKQIDWLAQVLAARGMPTVLLERHLRYLAAELDSVSDDPDRWRQLRHLADRLATRRRQAVADDALGRADAGLAAELGTGAASAVPHAGLLVAAAVADVLTEVIPDSESCVGWLADEHRFSQG